MELGLSLGDSSRPFVGFIEKPNSEASNQLGLGFNTTLSIGPIITTQKDQQQQQLLQVEELETKPENKNNNSSNRKEGHLHHGAATNDYPSLLSSKDNNPLMHHQLDLLPRLSFPWLHPSDKDELGGSSRSLDVNVVPAAAADDEAEEGVAQSSSPNSAASSFQMDLCIYNGRGSLSGSGGNYYNGGGVGGGGGSGDRKRDSDDGDEDDNVGGSSTRKKLRLSKEQSAFLEESFKEHSTLNPKQKLALAKQLNLRPRQVEVWFQNRRARTKLKQTEVDCEYLKRCCETLTEENRRLHKELQELRALKTSNPFYMQLPATTLTMCPSCEKVATNSTSTTTSSATINASNVVGAMAPAAAIVKTSTSNDSNPKVAIGLFPHAKPMFHSFVHTTQPHQHPSTPS